MNAFDVLVGLVAVSAAIGGYRLGLLTRSLSWLGLAAGFFVGIRLLPTVLESLADAGQGVRLAVATLVLIGCGLVGQALGLLAGGRLRVALPAGAPRETDRIAGAFAAVAVVGAAVWLLLPAVASVPGWPARQARTSQLGSLLAEYLPPPPDALAALRRLVGDSGFPEVFGGLQAAPELGPPPEASGLDAATARRAARSVVKVQAAACQRIQEGSGFVVDDGLVVTNAHVVAGQSGTTVSTVDGERFDAEVVAFDPQRDLAVLDAPELDRPPLPLGPGDVGGVGAVFGFPGGGPLRQAPFRIDDEVTALGRDIYDAGEVRRRIYYLAAGLRPGDSGSALVAPDGAVVGVAFAIAPDRPDVAYALTDDEVRAVLDTPLRNPVDTGPCLR